LRWNDDLVTVGALLPPVAPGLQLPESITHSSFEKHLPNICPTANLWDGIHLLARESPVPNLSTAFSFSLQLGLSKLWNRQLQTRSRWPKRHKDVTVRIMTIQRCALEIRVGEMMEIIDRIRGQGIVNVVATDGIDGVINHDVECLYYASETLGYQISNKDFLLSALEDDYEAIRKSLLSLVTRVAQITVSMTGPYAAVDRYHYAIRV
jgi:hypothetical protein